MTMVGIGSVFGSLIFTRMSDVIGRKPVMVGCMWVTVVIKLIQAFSVNYAMYLGLAFFDGLMQQVSL